MSKTGRWKEINKTAVLGQQRYFWHHWLWAMFTCVNPHQHMYSKLHTHTTARLFLPCQKGNTSHTFFSPAQWFIFAQFPTTLNLRNKTYLSVIQKNTPHRTRSYGWGLDEKSNDFRWRLENAISAHTHCQSGNFFLVVFLPFHGQTAAGLEIYGQIHGFRHEFSSWNATSFPENWILHEILAFRTKSNDFSADNFWLSPSLSLSLALPTDSRFFPFHLCKREAKTTARVLDKENSPTQIFPENDFWIISRPQLESIAVGFPVFCPHTLSRSLSRNSSANGGKTHTNTHTDTPDWHGQQLSETLAHATWRTTTTMMNDGTTTPRLEDGPRGLANRPNKDKSTEKGRKHAMPMTTRKAGSNGGASKEHVWFGLDDGIVFKNRK